MKRLRGGKPGGTKRGIEGVSKNEHQPEERKASVTREGILRRGSAFRGKILLKAPGTICRQLRERETGSGMKSQR